MWDLARDLQHPHRHGARFLAGIDSERERPCFGMKEDARVFLRLLAAAVLAERDGTAVEHYSWTPPFLDTTAICRTLESEV